jgi:hypothetical protein
VIKAANIAINAASQKWTHIIKRVPSAPNVLMTWGAPAPPAAAGLPTAEDLDRRGSSPDYVIVIDPGTITSQRILMNQGGVFFTTLNNNDFSFNNLGSTTTFPFEPYLDTQNSFVVYGIKPSTGSSEDMAIPRMPFNRADYYIDSPANLPTRCATSGLPPAQRTTGVLYKSVISHIDGRRTAPLPLLDCVADMQVVALASLPGAGGAINATWQGMPGYGTDPNAAQTISNQVREIRAYILAHEGQKDPAFTFTNFTGSSNPPFNSTCPGSCDTCIEVGENCMGSIFDLSKISAGSPDTNEYLRYRWKVYTVAATPYNIR